MKGKESATEENARKLREARELRNLHIWAWYMNGAKAMLRRLRESCLCEEPHMAMAKRGRSAPAKVTNEDKILKRAVLDLIMSSNDAIDNFLKDAYEIRFTDHEKDKKGRLVKCRAYFAEKIVTYKEVK